MAWTYEELLQGNTHVAYLMDGRRVVAEWRHYGIDVQNPGRGVEQTRRDFKRIVGLEAEVERLERLEPEIVEHVLDGRDLTDAAWTEAVIAIRHWREVAESQCDCSVCSQAAEE